MKLVFLYTLARPTKHKIPLVTSCRYSALRVAGRLTGHVHTIRADGKTELKVVG